MLRCMLGGLSSAGISDLGLTAAEDYRFFLPVFFILVQPRPETAGHCIVHARSGVFKSWSKIRFPHTITK